MFRDPIVEEVRKTRKEIFARFDHDLGKYVEYLRSKDRADGTTAGGTKTRSRKRVNTVGGKGKTRKPSAKRRAV